MKSPDYQTAKDVQFSKFNWMQTYLEIIILKYKLEHISKKTALLPSGSIRAFMF